ncbi:hypothetical protein FDECE_13035 [Fusarium decemcellulare]|nr:hypothetical protein FDECE_13035 [Fusarium decemcellulare]
MAKIYSPTPADSHRISEVYITSMAHNAILLLQYPTEEQQRQVQEYAATQFQSSIEKHPETTVVVRELDEENGDIMSFLKYEIHQEVKPEEPSKPAADLSSHNDNDDWYQPLC